MKHKHYDVIVAWAAGVEIQRKSFMTNDQWTDLQDGDEPCFLGSTEWRIKPDPRAGRDMAIARAVSDYFNLDASSASLDKVIASVKDES